MNEQRTSRLSGFYKQTIADRQAVIAQWGGLTSDDLTLLSGLGLSLNHADNMVENAIGIFGLPFGIATNFLINDKDYLIPMVIEEPSVIAAVSNAAKMFRAGGGFTASSDAPIMIGQIQVLDVVDAEVAAASVLAQRDRLLAIADETAGSILRRGGGARDIAVRVIADSRVGAMLIIHLLMDVRDAMGANAINTAVEYLAPHVEAITGGRANLRILSNLTDQRKARAAGVVPAAELGRGDFSGYQVAQAIVEAGVFAEVDPYRAATHNKGIMNGIDAVVIATGNDWRAIEAGAHAYAARKGTYSSLTRWWQDSSGDLHGEIEVPLAVGIVGGATRVHPLAQIALTVLGIDSAQQLAEITAAVGLAQNFAALRALSTEGIQQGHMRMHARQIAIAAGAEGAAVMRIAGLMIQEGNIRLERAKQLLEQIEAE